jgi:tripartite-type tricarboxylate transporter receptor subunit TctC
MRGPRGLPEDIAAHWNQEVGNLIRTEAMQKWLEREGMRAAGGSPDGLWNRLDNDLAKWKNVVKQSKIVTA